MPDPINSSSHSNQTDQTTLHPHYSVVEDQKTGKLALYVTHKGTQYQIKNLRVGGKSVDIENLDYFTIAEKIAGLASQVLEKKAPPSENKFTVSLLSDSVNQTLQAKYTTKSTPQQHTNLEGNDLHTAFTEVKVKTETILKGNQFVENTTKKFSDKTPPSPSARVAGKAGVVLAAAVAAPL